MSEMEHTADHLIAARLLLSRRTVATHVSHILKKLDVHYRTEIARESALRTIASEMITPRESQAPSAGTVSRQGDASPSHV
jgi:DNA-binding NarL/FixJ family response regulator